MEKVDRFPDCVCKNCENRITQFYAFREDCLAVYCLLRRTISPPNREKLALLEDTQLEPQDFVKTKLSEDRKTPKNSAFGICCETAGNFKSQHLTFEDPSSEKNLRKKSEKSLNVPSPVQENLSVATPPSEERENPNSVELPGKKTMEIEKLADMNLAGSEANAVKYKCENCDNLFTDLAVASEHCLRCCEADQEEELPEEPKALEYTVENFQGAICNSGEKKEERQMGLKKRYVSNLDEKRDPISSIKISSFTRLNLIRKKKIGNEFGHSCPDCDNIFSSEALLRRHRFVHTGERPYECPLCKKRFSQIGQLNFHKNFHENPRYRCAVCTKPFLRPSDVEKHMRTHTGEKPYVCQICSKSFAQLVALQQHERIHTGDKPYVCDVCNKGFSQKANMMKHIKIHRAGEKPHTCDKCGRSFSDIEEMRLHRAGHGGGKPRKCDYCGESFRKMSELSQHIRRIHTFEKPHTCAFCQKAFYSLHNLKQHVMVHTGQKPHACSKCNLRFTQKGNLTKHFERKHVDHSSNEGKFVVIEDEDEDEDREDEMITLANDLLRNASDSLIIEREETVEVDTTLRNE